MLIAVLTGFPIQDRGPVVAPLGVALRVVLDRVGAIEIPPTLSQPWDVAGAAGALP